MGMTDTLNRLNTTVTELDAPIKGDCYFVPDDVSEPEKATIAKCLKARPWASPELRLLKMHYEGDEILLDRIFKKPAAWSDDEWEAARRLQILVNSTRASIRMLVGNLYGGTQSRILKGTAEGTDEINDFIASPRFGSIMRKRARNAFLFGTASQVPTYDNREFDIWTLDPSRTTYIQDKYSGVTEAVVEFSDPKLDFMRAITTLGMGIFGKSERHSKWTEFSRPLKIEPWVVSNGYPSCGDSIYGTSMVRECPKIDSNLSQLWWALSLVARMKGANIITLFTAEKSANFNTASVGFDTMLILDQDDKVGQISNSTNISEMISAMESMMGTESAILGTPTSKDARSHQSATGAEIQNSSLASQVQLLVKDAIEAEIETVIRVVQIYRVNNSLSDMTRTEIIKAYQPEISIVSSIDDPTTTTKLGIATSALGLGIEPETSAKLAGLNPDILPHKTIQTGVSNE